MTKEIQKLKEKILIAIQEGKLKQKSKYYFVFLSFISILGIITLFTLVLYLLSFMILIFQEQHIFHSFGLSPKEIFNFIHAVPILLMFFVVILLITLYILINKYKISYQHPIMASIVGIFLITVLIMLGIMLLDKKMSIGHFGEQKGFPILRSMHEHYRNFNMQIEDKILYTE